MYTKLDISVYFVGKYFIGVYMYSIFISWNVHIPICFFNDQVNYFICEQKMEIICRGLILH